MHLQQDTSFDIDLSALGQGHRKCSAVPAYPLHHVTYVIAKFEVATSKGLGDYFTRKYIISALPLTFGSR